MVTDVGHLIGGLVRASGPGDERVCPRCWGAPGPDLSKPAARGTRRAGNPGAGTRGRRFGHEGAAEDLENALTPGRAGRAGADRWRCGSGVARNSTIYRMARDRKREPAQAGPGRSVRWRTWPSRDQGRAPGLWLPYRRHGPRERDGPYSGRTGQSGPPRHWFGVRTWPKRVGGLGETGGGRLLGR